MIGVLQQSKSLGENAADALARAGDDDDAVLQRWKDDILQIRSVAHAAPLTAALCQAGPNSPPPRMFARANTPPRASHAAPPAVPEHARDRHEVRQRQRPRRSGRGSARAHQGHGSQRGLGIGELPVADHRLLRLGVLALFRSRPRPSVAGGRKWLPLRVAGTGLDDHRARFEDAPSV